MIFGLMGALGSGCVVTSRSDPRSGQSLGPREALAAEPGFPRVRVQTFVALRHQTGGMGQFLSEGFSDSRAYSDLTEALATTLAERGVPRGSAGGWTVKGYVGPAVDVAGPNYAILFLVSATVCLLPLPNPAERDVSLLLLLTAPDGNRVLRRLPIRSHELSFCFPRAADVHRDALEVAAGVIIEEIGERR